MNNKELGATLEKCLSTGDSEGIYWVIKQLKADPINNNTIVLNKIKALMNKGKKIKYTPDLDLRSVACSVCGEFCLDDSLCFNCKDYLECVNCCGCLDDEGK